MKPETMSNAALAITTIIDAERAPTHDDLRILAGHLSDRLGVCDAETLGGMLTLNLFSGAKETVEPTLDDRFRTILAHVRAATTLQELRACEEEVDAGRRAGFTSTTSGTLLTKISKREQGVLEALVFEEHEQPAKVTP